MSGRYDMVHAAEYRISLAIDRDNLKAEQLT